MAKGILTAVALVLVLAPPALAASCGSAQTALRLDWSAVGWMPGGTTETVLAEHVSRPGEGLSQPVTVALSGATKRLEPGYPAVSAEFTGGRGAGTESFAMATDFANRKEVLILRLDFASPVAGLSFDIFDVDFVDRVRSQRGFRDGVTVTGYDAAGAAVAPALTSPHIPSGTGTSRRATVYLGPPLATNQAMGFRSDAAPGVDGGNVEVRFTSPVSSVTVGYSNGFDPPANNPQEQAIALSDLTFCNTLGAELNATKTQRLISESGTGCRDFGMDGRPDARAAIPGACIEYRVSVTNSGAGAATDIRLTDVLDDDLIFQAADVSGFGGGADGVQFSRPAAGQDCGATECVVGLNEATLPAGATGRIRVRATLR
ncbi:conserved repeat domain-containing protein [Tranquillimonas rosea]|uniref:Conserved repeat domain-containing protein n=1 Tax=Tranquillimonas rosea TaxID=641238 RepID=A0A1H9SPT9_9RHOB|nr:DUF11 domain-containing protein [Tranquillimonas rosea]SER86868.1 conserved repeat domain-containing protein [Tranquillimonas rosea]